MAGPEAPQYIVKPLDFFASGKDILGRQISLIDFDQSFRVSEQPTKLLGTPVEFLSPEVAIGHSPSQASDIWALGCTIMRLRSGTGLFAAYDIDSPIDLVRAMIDTFGNLPRSWGTPVFDRDGKPTHPQNPKGQTMVKGCWDQSLFEWVSQIWDYPSSLDETNYLPSSVFDDPRLIRPYPSSLSGKIWRPAAVRVNGIFLKGYRKEADDILAKLPKIDKNELELLYNLLSKILRYETTERPGARVLLDHPWFTI